MELSYPQGFSLTFPITEFPQEPPSPASTVAEAELALAQVGTPLERPATSAIAAASGAPANDEAIWTATLNDNQTKTITSRLLNPTITFYGEAELLRAQKPLLPTRLYRTFYETSATLSCFVTKDTHVKHREKPDLKLKDGIAFQPIGDFDIYNFLTKEAIERHLVWNQKKIPTVFISAFDQIFYAKRRAGFHDKVSQRIGERVSIAEINTAGLIPATVHAQCETTTKIVTSRPFMLDEVRQKITLRHVDIPVWIRDTAKDQFCPKLTPEQLEASGADMWISITEIRKSNLKDGASATGLRRDSICAKGHNYEWLCCGPIATTLIEKVMPWDGKNLHFKDPGSPVLSFGKSGLTWIYNWERQMWLADHHKDYFAAQSGKVNNGKRKRGDDEHENDDDPSTEADDLPWKVPSTRANVLQFSPITTTIDLSPN